jgi:hypothetical protein
VAMSSIAGSRRREVVIGEVRIAQKSDGFAEIV